MTASNDTQPGPAGSDAGDRLMACLEVGKLLTSTRELDEILALIVSKLSQLIEAENWSLMLRDEESGELTFEVVVGIDADVVRDMRLTRGQGIAGHVAETGEPLFLADVRSDPRFHRDVDAKTGFTTQSIACVPLRTHGRVLGVIEVINVRDMAWFESRDLPILTVFADYAAIAIENCRYVERIERMSVTDEYTGLHNARHLHVILDGLIEEADDRGTPIAVAFVDVDDFKAVVDTYGHLSGSQVLKEIGETIGSCLSETDVLVKYGGDEYVIVMPGRSKPEAAELAREMLEAVRAATYLESEGSPIKVTASFGIGVYPEDAQTKKHLLILADDSMYRVKESTKNGVGMVRE